MKDFDQIRVEGLFLDYDGTISPLNVPREESKVPEETEAILRRIRQLIPVGITTTKDLSFIVPRTPFASAWCAIGGLEIKIGEKIIVDQHVQKALRFISPALQYTSQHSDNYLFIEEKRDSAGETIAFCVDWRKHQNSKDAETKANNVMDYCQRLPLNVIKYEGQPFFDVYPCPIDKGKALVELKRNLGVSGAIMYMGDSKVDNPAFNIADVSVGVLHEETHANLTCNYYVKYESVASLLQHLKENNMVFSQDFPEISLSRSGKEGR
jgi:HAD superfamily hydrolase (TIGR01484 family)